MGLLLVRSTLINMNTFVALSALMTVAVAAPTAEADAQLLYGGAYGAGLAGLGGYAGLGRYAGLAGGYAGLAGGYAGLAGAIHAPVAAPVATVAYASAPAVAYAHAAPAFAYHAAPAVAVTPVHQVTNHVVTAPVVRHVGTQVHHQVHHIPNVAVDTKSSTVVRTHVINHAPVVGAYVAHPALLAAAPVVVAAPAVAAE